MQLDQDALAKLNKLKLDVETGWQARRDYGATDRELGFAIQAVKRDLARHPVSQKPAEYRLDGRPRSLAASLIAEHRALKGRLEKLEAQRAALKQISDVFRETHSAKCKLLEACLAFLRDRGVDPELPEIGRAYRGPAGMPPDITVTSGLSMYGAGAALPPAPSPAPNAMRFKR